MKAYTDYPFTALGDIAGEKAPIREIEVIRFDGNKYVKIIVNGLHDEIKYGYVYESAGRLGEVKTIPVSRLPK